MLKGQAPQACVLQGLNNSASGLVVGSYSIGHVVGLMLVGGCDKYKTSSSLESNFQHQIHFSSYRSSIFRSLSKTDRFSPQQPSNFSSTTRTAMCLRSSFDKFAIPSIYDVEGITTMPVCPPQKLSHRHVQQTDGPRFPVAAVPPVWNAGTRYG